MVLGAITGVPTPACLSAASNPVEAVTPPFGCWHTTCCWHSKNYIQYTALPPPTPADQNPVVIACRFRGLPRLCAV